MSRPIIDFGKAAEDYAQHRPGFPDAFFERIRDYGIVGGGQDILDLGCGTGALARGFAERGARVVGVDLSPEMLRQAHALAAQQRVHVELVRAAAEAIGLADTRFDVVCAGQCWHWFDGHRAAVETRRVLRRGGQVLLAYFTYLSEPASLGAMTEGLILKHNPTWPLAGADGRMPFLVSHLTGADFVDVETFEFEIDIPMSHAAWRGRIRASNGVILMSPEVQRQFDLELADRLREKYADPLQVPHRIYVIVARKP